MQQTIAHTLDAERLQAIQQALELDPLFGTKLSQQQRQGLSTLFTNKTVELEANHHLNLHSILKRDDPPTYMALLVGSVTFRVKKRAACEIEMNAPCILRVHMASRIKVCACAY